MNDFLMRSAGPDDLDELVRLEKAVEQRLPNRDMFATDDREFYEPIIEGAGHILLAFDGENKLAGASVIRFPAPDDPENLGRSMSLPESARADVRHLESVFVRPDIRGKGLAERLIRENMRLTEHCGRTISMATVWPGNAASLRLHVRLGLYLRGFALKYGGKPRYILMSGGTPAKDAEPELADALDTARNCALLKAGLAGTAVLPLPDDEHAAVEYRPLIFS